MNMLFTKEIKKQALNHGLVLKKGMAKIIKQNALRTHC